MRKTPPMFGYVVRIISGKWASHAKYFLFVFHDSILTILKRMFHKKCSVISCKRKKR
jgi:hypothetical protein